MQYAGFLIRRERLNRNWSQEGLCKGICTVSYLSKIEQGKAEPSDLIATQLLQRMEIQWTPASNADRAFFEEAYEQLFSGDIDSLRSKLAEKDEKITFGPHALDWMILSRICNDLRTPLEEALDACLDNRQLALQRCLQKRYDEALHLYPNAFLYYWVGAQYYWLGDTSTALEHLQTAYDLAAREGRAWIMLNTQTIMGNCYSNHADIAAMENHYSIAMRLAKALGAEDQLDSIRYNIASTQLQAGEYEQAMGYFGALSVHTKMTLHKLAICYEKLDQPYKAIAVLDQADQIQAQEYFPVGLEQQMCDAVRFRLEHGEYLNQPQYGTLLLTCFEDCRKQLPSGYAIFHLPWVLEWHEYHRQYKQAYGLLRDFPDYSRKG